MVALSFWRTFTRKDSMSLATPFAEDRASPINGSLMPKICPWKASWMVCRTLSRPSTNEAGSDSRAKMLGISKVKWSQPGRSKL